MTQYLSQFSAAAWTFAMNLGLGIVILIVSVALSSAARNLIRRVAARASPSKADVILLFAQIARIGLIIFGVVTALGTMGLNVSALVAGLGLTGFALGFAFRDALSNVLAGAMILLHQPFHRGDQIKVAEFEGVVSEINLRYTIIQREGSRVLIPNANLLTNPIVVAESAAPRPPAMQ